MARHRTDLTYRVRPVPERNRLHVSCELELSAGRPVELGLATWIPGSYLIREFSRYLGELAISSSGATVELERIDKARWRLTAEEACVCTVAYEVFAHELTVRTPHVDHSHAFFNGANVFLYPTTEQSSFRVAIDLPDGWQPFVALPEEDGYFLAESWDVLADTAFEIGPHRCESFVVDGIQHRLVFWGDQQVDIDKGSLTANTKRIVEYHRDLFGALPYEQYDFIFHITPSARGGLEHLSSTTLATPWSYFEDPEQQQDLLTLISHEHFHAWNGKRIRPFELGPFDYQAENYTRGLWVVEGFTSYFDEYNVYRAGLMSRDAFLARLSRSIATLQRVPGRQAQSVAEASYDAWIRLYRPDEDTPNRTVSYYLKGSVISVLLDLTIRSRSNGRYSLDDVMKHLHKRFMNDGAGYDSTQMAGIIRSATGVDVENEIESWVHRTEELPISEILRSHGIVRSESDEEPTLKLGIKGSMKPDGFHVRTVYSDGANSEGPLQPGDVIVAANGRQAGGYTLGKLLRDGENRLHVFRLGRLLELVSPVRQAPTEPQYVVSTSMSDTERALCERWLPHTE